eukprot:2581179-Rhodomonas_salina.1
MIEVLELTGFWKEREQQARVHSSPEWQRVAGRVERLQTLGPLPRTTVTKCHCAARSRKPEARVHEATAASLGMSPRRRPQQLRIMRHRDLRLKGLRRRAAR